MILMCNEDIKVLIIVNLIFLYNVFMFDFLLEIDKFVFNKSID